MPDDVPHPPAEQALDPAPVASDAQAAVQASPEQQQADAQAGASPPRYEFFVYIVESPSPVDLYHGRSEGGLVARALALDRIPCVTRTAISPAAFRGALQVGLPEAMKRFGNRYPILHISAHGSLQGVQLSSGDVVGWPQLRELLLPINESLGGALLLCMSACEGYSACQMAMQEQQGGPHPYFAMVGNYSNPTWSDTAVSYLAFYHLLAKGHTVFDGVRAMNVVCGTEDGNAWTSESAEDIVQGYIAYLKTSSEPSAAQAELEAVADHADLPADAKALERGLHGQQ